MLHTEPGWFGMFTRHQAKGAIPNGTVIQKIMNEPGDAHDISSIGTVLGSLGTAELGIPDQYHGQTVKFMYFIEWRDQPRVACGTSDYKIARLD